MEYYLRSKYAILDDGSLSGLDEVNLSGRYIINNNASWTINQGETFLEDDPLFLRYKMHDIMARDRENRQDVLVKKLSNQVEELQATLVVTRNEKAALRTEIEQLQATLAVLRLPPPIKYPAVPIEPEAASESPDEECVCVICTERPKSTCMVPCGHTYACVTCVLKNKPIACGICRAPIEQVIRKYE